MSGVRQVAAEVEDESVHGAAQGAADGAVDGAADGREDGPAREGWAHRSRARWHDRRERIRADAHANRVYRAVVGTVGTAVVVLGLILVPLPGPGWLVVFIGLAVLSSEFSSAKRVKDFGERQLHRWTRWLGRQPIAVRALLAAGTALVVAAVVWGYLAVVGIPGWLPHVVTAELQLVPGL